jgi:hypothetical protein
LVTVGTGLAERVCADGELECTEAGGLIVVVLHAARPRTTTAPIALLASFIVHLPSLADGLQAADTLHFGAAHAPGS